MLAKDLSFQALPHLKLSDSVLQALQLMQESHTQHLAVCTTEGTFIGIVSENLLVETQQDWTIAQLELLLQPLCVKHSDHFLQAVALASLHKLTVVPIIDAEGVLVHTVSTHDLLDQLAHFLNLTEPGALLVLEVAPSQYSFSEIGKIVESNDAYITQLNTTLHPVSHQLLITLRINKTEISDIVAAFQRYDYIVKYYLGEELYANEIKDNYHNLMNYLNI